MKQLGAPHHLSYTLDISIAITYGRVNGNTLECEKRSEIQSYFQ